MNQPFYISNKKINHLRHALYIYIIIYYVLFYLFIAYNKY